MTVDDLIEKLGNAAAAVEDLAQRQDEIYVQWQLLLADAAVLGRKLEAFAERAPGCLDNNSKE